MMKSWTNLELAIGIGLIVLGVVGLIFVLDAVLTADNASKYAALATILAAVVGIPTLVVVGYQAVQLKHSVDVQRRQSQLQADAFELEHRPYLHLQLENYVLEQNPDEANAWFGGGDCVFKNVGKDPATITNTRTWWPATGEE